MRAEGYHCPQLSMTLLYSVVAHESSRRQMDVALCILAQLPTRRRPLLFGGEEGSSGKCFRLGSRPSRCLRDSLMLRAGMLFVFGVIEHDIPSFEDVF